MYLPPPGTPTTYSDLQKDRKHNFTTNHAFKYSFLTSNLTAFFNLVNHKDQICVGWIFESPEKSGWLPEKSSLV